jgi:hypothetical protein
MGAAVDVELLYEELLIQAEEARESPTRFFEFVMREETTREAVKILPHQRVLLDFIEAHPRCVLKLPPGFTKTFTTASFALYLLGKDPTMRGCIVSATEGQASKVLGMVRDYIEESDNLHVVFPELHRSPRRSDPWTQTELTVIRPRGIRDASLRAVGAYGAIDGSRLNWILVDDVLNAENTNTSESRDKLYSWFDTSVRTRLDPKGARFVVCNTVWHPDDLVNRLEKNGWPCLTMRIDGTIVITNTDWDTDDIRPANDVSADCRLTAHGPDPDNVIPLWPAKFSNEVIADIRRETLPITFARLFMASTTDDETALCKQAYIEECKKTARQLGFHEMGGLRKAFWNQLPTFIGVDLAVSEKGSADDTAIFAFCVMEDGTRVPLHIEYGKWPVDVILAKVIAAYETYGGIVIVENNGAQQYLVQLIRKLDKSIPVRSHTTTSAKANPVWGVPALFTEMSNGAWAIPNDKAGRIMDKAVQRWVNEMLEYKPKEHTGDVLMACYFAREMARKVGALVSAQRRAPGTAGPGAAIAAAVMMR